SSFFAYSLHSRASLRAASSTLPNQTPGFWIEVIAVVTPPLSMSSSDISTDHLVGLPPRFCRIASACTGGMMWWCTSIRLPGAGAGAAGTDGVAAAAAAVPPARKLRRFTAVPAKGAGSLQHTHPARKFRPIVLFIASLPRYATRRLPGSLVAPASIAQTPAGKSARDVTAAPAHALSARLPGVGSPPRRPPRMPPHRRLWFTR